MVDYKRRAILNTNHFFEDKSISKVNKKHLTDFLQQYHVSDARMGIFMRMMRIYMQYSDDIKKEMHDSQKINAIFFKIKQRGYALSVYKTIFSCVRRLCIWLNDGDRPKGLRDIKTSKTDFMRDLSPNDMISLDDIELLSNNIKSIQFKAILWVLFDSGMRPSEFTSLLYGDITTESPFLAYECKGKTGKRKSWLFRSVPHLKSWLEQHPTKKKNDPLWVSDEPYRNSKTQTDSNISYKYEAIQKRIKELAERIKFKKPVDMYNFRHSCAIQMALDNVPIEQRSKKMGHSLEMHNSIYGRWDTEKELRAVATSFGIERKKEQNTPKVCSFCDSINKSDAEYCFKCSNPLTTAVAVRDKEKQDSQNKNVQKQLDDMKRFLIQQFSKRDKIDTDEIISDDDIEKIFKGV